MRRRPTLTGALAWVLVVLTSCAPARVLPMPSDITGKVARIGFIAQPPGGRFLAFTWLAATQRLAVSYEPPGPLRSGDFHIYTTTLDSTAELARLPLPPEPSCSATAQVVPSELRDGRLAYIQSCYGAIARVPQESNTLLAYEPVTGTVSELFSYRFHQNAVQYALSPDLSRGVISDGNGLSERLWRLGPTGLQQTPLTFERVRGPTWSPDGSTLAVAAVATGATTRGLDRLDLPWGLYLLDQDLTHQRLVMDGFSGLGAFHWSPDGKWLLGAAAVGTEPAGLWLVEVRTGRAELVVSPKEQVGGGVWLPDGRTIVVAVGVDTHSPPDPGEVAAERIGLAILRLPELKPSQ